MIVHGEDLTPDSPAVRWAHRKPLHALLLIALGLGLYLPGLNWGLPGTVSWSQDTVAGMRTVLAMHGWPQRWVGRYPPLQFMLNAALYKPVYATWEAEGRLVTDARYGFAVPAPPQAEPIGKLVRLSRLLTVAMACGTGIGLWLAARRLTGHPWAALLAAAAFMIGADFVYFAHLGNVDVPSMFWFAWSLYAFARALRSSSGANCALLGCLAALAVCTKDGVAGAYPGMALALILADVYRRRLVAANTDPDAAEPGFAASLLQARWLIGLAAFALPFLYINGLFHTAEPFMNRLKHWSAETGTIHSLQQRYDNPLALAWMSIRYAASATGWPMVAALAAATVHAIRRHPRLAMHLLLPVASYYLLVIQWMLGFVYARFLFPILAMLAVLLGVAAVDWWRAMQRRPAVRVLVPLAVALPTIGYALWVNIELTRDTRYEAEAWFAEHAPAPADVGVFVDKFQYLPRLPDLGYRIAVLAMTRETFARPAPPYLVLSSYDYHEYDADRAACLDELVDGRLGFEVVAVFSRSRWGDSWSWLAAPAIGVERPGKISPTILVLQQSGG
jgi:hypothetical protein